MAVSDHEVMTFRRHELAAVVEVCDELARTGTGEGWVNIGPALTEEQLARVPVRSPLAAWFSGRGPAIPMATWTPPTSGPRPRPVVVGVSHGTGPNALDRLTEAGVALAPGWRRRQDHAKHGIVVEVGPDVATGEVVSWLVAAVEVLNPLGPTDEWYAEIHRPGGG